MTISFGVSCRKSSATSISEREEWAIRERWLKCLEQSVRTFFVTAIETHEQSHPQEVQRLNRVAAGLRSVVGRFFANEKLRVIVAREKEAPRRFVFEVILEHNVERDPDESNAPPELTPIEALASAGIQRGTLVTVRDREAADSTDERASPAIPCLMRPAFSLSRIHLRRDGLVTYRVKKLGRRRAPHRVMTPVEFLARMASLIPPPRYPTSRLHGVFGPRHRWRARVVPKPPEPALRCPRFETKKDEPKKEKARTEAVEIGRTLAALGARAPPASTIGRAAKG